MPKSIICLTISIVALLMFHVYMVLVLLHLRGEGVLFLLKQRSIIRANANSICLPKALPQLQCRVFKVLWLKIKTQPKVKMFSLTHKY
jgi:hypothetical protein